MPHIAHVSVVVRDYDEALAFYIDKLGFTLVEDKPVPEQNKRWVTIRPPGAPEGATTILLARASTHKQRDTVGRQTGDNRVFLFLATDDFERDYKRFEAVGVRFVRETKVEEYGTVAVFEDLYGNLWDLVQFT